ncbi:Hypothetical predicted protein [Mytilus galloprovincialis]|uniref:Novel STAND NTPase 3 domain-containing protein n=2 Tax=Mytilus galloprovincialis TaxID=29158 RepID=A0A8B6DC22_MYTGA|nr:Hypothetical predicted protein [Mytilus galloprovincialis]
MCMYTMERCLIVSILLFCSLSGSVTGLKCYTCDDVAKPSLCNVSQVCSQPGQVCIQAENVNDDFRFSYKLGCGGIQYCHGTKKRNLRHFCCSTDLCNTYDISSSTIQSTTTVSPTARRTTQTTLTSQQTTTRATAAPPQSHTDACILEHSKDDTYVITKDVKKCCDILDKHKILVIIAKAGGGKSKTSIQIAMMYKEQTYTPMLFLNNEITRKRELVNFNKNNIIIVDNLFDESNIDRYLNEDLYRGILDVLYSCCKAESCKSKLIITVRGNNQIQMKLNESHQIFENEVIINLDEKRSLHSNELMLSKHMNRHGISLCQCKKVTNIRSVFFPAEVNPQCKSSVSEMKDTSLQVCVSLFNEICSGKYDIHIGFPEVCNLFCSNKNITKLGIEYFTHASQSLVKEIKKLKKQGFDNRNMQYQYCVLVYTSIKSSIDVDDIDKNCFQNILSNYENNKIIISLLKEAVRRLDGTYLIKQSSSESSCNNSKRRKVSEIYVRQHFTVKEAILITYGEDVDILSFCDFRFLFEYIRPRGYKFSTSDHMVHHLTDYKLLAKKLISVLSTDDCTCISVGVYLQKVGLMQSDDKLIPFFFETLEDVKPDQYVCLLNGLTNLGKNAHLIKFHPQLCTKIINNGGWIVFLASHRPIGWSYNDTNFFEIETNTLIEKLIFMMTLNRFNGKDPNSKENERKCHPLSSLSTFVNYHYAIGNYVFENLIAKGFIDTAEILLIAITQKEHEINPIHIKEFLDGLLDRGKRASVVSKFKGFFESVLFKYGSILTVLQLCRPLTSNITDSNILLVDDNLLTGKLSAHLESTFGDKSDLKQTVPKESGAYFVHWDYNYFQMGYIDDIARFVLEHGVKVSNDKFVRTMFEKLVSYTPRIEEIFHAGRFELESLFQNEDEEDVAIAKTIVLDDYPDEEIGEDENGSVVYRNLKDIFVRRVYQEHCILFGPTYHRLFEFLSFLMVRWYTNEDSKYERMTILREKFDQLFYITREKDMFCEFDSHDSDGSFESEYST